MASTFQGLVDRFQLQIDRDDVTEQIAASSGNTINIANDCIARAERRFYRSPVSNLPPFEKRVVYSVEAGQSTLQIPADYDKLMHLYSDNGDGDRRVVMERVSPEQILDTIPSVRVSLPGRIAYNSNEWIIDPPNSAVTITAYFYGELSPLSSVTDPTTSHWLLNRADDLILYWAAVEAGLYYSSIDQTLLSAWEGKGTEIEKSIIDKEARQRRSGSRSRWGKAYSTPGFYSLSGGTAT